MSGVREDGCPSATTRSIVDAVTSTSEFHSTWKRPISTTLTPTTGNRSTERTHHRAKLLGDAPEELPVPTTRKQPLPEAHTVNTDPATVYGYSPRPIARPMRRMMLDIVTHTVFPLLPLCPAPFVTIKGEGGSPRRGTSKLDNTHTYADSCYKNHVHTPGTWAPKPSPD